MKKFTFLTMSALATAFLLAELSLAQSFSSGQSPNMLWLTAEDLGPHLGCYGDPVARTPNIDALAKKGMVYDLAWSNYPVCAPARTTIITGMYPASHGAGHMRCLRPLPVEYMMLPQYLRAIGYYCSNRSKEDYNHPKPGTVWDETGRKAHYRNRKPGQPFFSVFNQTCTHESQIRKRPHKAIIAANSVNLPAYWPGHRTVQKDWAQYYDNITKLDNWVGKQLRQLATSGLADNTIVVFFGDHGSGMPRHKRHVGDSGMRVPMIVYFPEKWQHLAPLDYQPNSHSRDAIGFIDLAPTTMSIAGLQPPRHFHGRAFAGSFRQQGTGYLFGFKERMDERPDLARSVRDENFLYIRNFMPHLPAGQPIAYQQLTPTTKLWRQLYREQKLNPLQSRFFQPRPDEELYDLSRDPEENRNIAKRPSHQRTLQRFRQLLRRKTSEIRDTGFMPESFIQTIAEKTALQKHCKSETNYPISKIFQVASQATAIDKDLPGRFLQQAQSENSVIRYWIATALVCRGAATCREHEAILRKLLQDPSSPVSVAAAEAVALYLSPEDRRQAVEHLIKKSDLNRSDYYTCIDALNALGRIQEQGVMGNDFPLEKLRTLPAKTQKIKRGNSYVRRLLEFIEERSSDQKVSSNFP